MNSVSVWVKKSTMERRRKERKVNLVTIMSIPFQIPKIKRKKKHHGFRERSLLR